MTDGNALPGQGEGPIDWEAALPDSVWLKVRPGDTVEMTIVGRELRDSNLHPGERELVANVLVDGTERKWSPNVSALRELAANDVRDGDHIRVTRGDDIHTKSGRPKSTWIIEKHIDRPKTQVDAEMDAPVKGGDDDAPPF
jgi:hypothetical protein